MSKRVKKNRHRKMDPYIPVCILLLGAVIVAGSMSLGGEKEKLEDRLPKILEWEKKEQETVEALPKEMKYEVHLEVPKNVQIIQQEENSVKITWNGCEDAMAYDVCIEHGEEIIYEEVYKPEFIHKDMDTDEPYTYKIRARRYGLYTYWSPNILCKLEIEE